MPTSLNPLLNEFETMSCGRCGGSGQHSYCQMHGTTCFGCGGRGKVYTKRGRAAVAYLVKLRTKKVTDVKAGMFIKIDGGKWRKVISANPSNCGKYFCLETQKIAKYVFLDGDIQAVVDNTEAEAAKLKALEYQFTLTKLGKPAKTSKLCQ